MKVFPRRFSTSAVAIALFLLIAIRASATYALSEGDILVAQRFKSAYGGSDVVIMKIDPATGASSTFTPAAGLLFVGRAIAIDSRGNVWLLANSSSGNRTLYRIDGDTGEATDLVATNTLTDIDLDSNEDLIAVTDGLNPSIIRIDPDDFSQEVIGPSISLNYAPNGLAVEDDDRILILYDWGVVRFDPATLAQELVCDDFWGPGICWLDEASSWAITTCCGGDIIVGTKSAGLLRIDSVTGLYSTMAGFSLLDAKGMAVDEDGTGWLTAGTGGPLTGAFSFDFVEEMTTGVSCINGDGCMGIPNDVAIAPAQIPEPHSADYLLAGILLVLLLDRRAKRRVPLTANCCLRGGS